MTNLYKKVKNVSALIGIFFISCNDISAEIGPKAYLKIHNNGKELNKF